MEFPSPDPPRRFPFIDESASLVDDLHLRDILKLGHRTNSRRLPRWKEIQYEHKKGHRSFLRRRQVKLGYV